MPTDYEAIALKFAPHHICAAAKRFCFLAFDRGQTAGAEAISVNGQRLTGISEIRCAGPTLSVNNVRSSAPFEIRAIGDKKSLENALRMRGGVAETLGVWGIQLDIKASNDVYIPPYRGSIRQSYARETAEREEESK